MQSAPDSPDRVVLAPADAPASRAALDPRRIRAWSLAYLRQAPLSLCLRELHRLVAVELLEVDQPRRTPVLDVGCGDGFWWTLRDTDGLDIYGIDISRREIAAAQTRIKASYADISAERPLAPLQFQSIVGNCSLEHVRDIDSALRNLREAASDDARLVLFVPAPQWGYQGRMQKALLSAAPRIAMAFSGAMNGFFQHWHLYDVPLWSGVLARNGWKIVRAEGLGNPRAEFLFRALLPPAYVQFLVKSAIGVYPSRLNRWLPDRVLAPLVETLAGAVAEPFVPVTSQHAYEFAIVAEAS